jgi:hypothetical protein
MCFAKTCRVAWLPLANASGGPPECPRLHAGDTQRGPATSRLTRRTGSNARVGVTFTVTVRVSV